MIKFVIRFILYAKIKKKNNKFLNKLRAYNFLSTVYSYTTPTLIIHLYVLQKPPFCNDKGY